MVQTSLGKCLLALSIPLITAVSFSSHAVAAPGGRVQLQPMAGVRTVDAPGQLRQGSVARIWNEAMLAAVRKDAPRPTVISRTLFATSAAMYDAWASYDSKASGVFVDAPVRARGNRELERREAVSYAAYRVLSHRFAASPNQAVIQYDFEQTMWALGYAPGFTDTAGDSAAAVGNRIGFAIIEQTLGDGANELYGYSDTSGFIPTGAPLTVLDPKIMLTDINAWQPLITPGSDQSQPQAFLTPHWGSVAPFALTRPAPDALYLDPGMPPRLGGEADQDAQVKAEVLQLIRFSGQLDPNDGVRIDISPAVLGNSSLGSNDGPGHPVNPATGEAYADNQVLRGDWTRVLSEFWADGPLSSTPPGHWNEIANEVSDALKKKRIQGRGRAVDALEWDVKLYLALNGALHDTAIATWEVKREYNYARPITTIRGLAEMGALPLEPGVVEERDGEIMIYAWKGHPLDAGNDFGGAGWISPGEWIPYQDRGFVTPPFPGYSSGHSGFSRAAAEVLTLMTGSPYFPGGLGEFVASTGVDGFDLNFEFGPSEAVRLQWATYYDAADEAGLSRIYGGIHPSLDDLPGRVIGDKAGKAAFKRAVGLFAGE